MRTRFFATLSILLALTGAAFAQHPEVSSPYAGLETRPIKALSAQQIEDLRTGRGMALALAGELNGYPGPQHVLDLATELGLSEAQRIRIQELIGEMKGAAIPLGEKLIAQEAVIDALFVERSVTPESLAVAIRASGELQAALRDTHLRYHLATIAILTRHQIRRYADLRGYASGGHAGPREHARP